MRTDAYITQYIIAGIGHLRQLDVDAGSSTELTTMAEKGLSYIDYEMTRRYNDMKSRRGFDPNADNIGPIEVNYLYARRFFTNKDVSSDNNEAFLYWKGQAQKFWTTKGLMAQGMIALALKRFDDANTPTAIIASLRERALHSDELGTYWKFEEGAIKDASTNFFIDWLPKGVWVFEYPLRVSQKGRFSNGISTVQSMYAPEFASHTGGTIVRVE